MSERQRESPYQGLTPYDEGDAPYFFGREKETKLITASLFAAPLTLLYGASGVGKSSVLRAGALNALRPRKDVLVVVFNQWQGNPLIELKSFIARAAKPLIANKRSLSKFSSPNLNGLSLTEFLMSCSAYTKRRLMIILDQFEEYSLYHPEDDAFALELPNAINRSDLSASFLLSLREDALAGLDRFEGRIPTLFSNFRRIDHLDRAAAKKAIIQPIAQYNKMNKLHGDSISIESALVEQVLEQVRTGQVLVGETGKGTLSSPAAESSKETRVETPYLQLVMTRLWNEEIQAESPILRLTTLNALGGAERIVLTHLDAVMGKFTEAEKELAARVFNQLVTPSGTKIAHMVRDLADYATVSQGDIRPLLDKLSAGSDRILRPVASLPEHPGEARYEIFHDRLGPAILDWRSRYLKEQELTKTKREEAERRNLSQRHIDSFLNDLSDREREVTASIFPFLVTPAGTKIAKSVSDLAEHTRSTAADLLPILEKLCLPEEGILHRVTLSNKDETAYEILHDALGPAILNWLKMYSIEKDLKKLEPAPTPEKTENVRSGLRPGSGHRNQTTLPHLVISDFFGRGMVIPFLGPGINFAARPKYESWREDSDFLPSGRELAQALAVEAGFPSQDERDSDLGTVALFYEQVLGRRLLYERLQRILGRPFPLTGAHRYLAKISKSQPLMIITTNYDSMMEHAFDEEALPYDVVVNTVDKPGLRTGILWYEHGNSEPKEVHAQELVFELDKTSVIFKILGSVNQRDAKKSSYVITDTDYLDLVGGRNYYSPLPAVAMQKLQMCSALFLGLGIAGWANRALVYNLFGINRIQRTRSWSVLFHPSPLEVAFWQHLGIDIHDEAIDEFLLRLDKPSA